MVKYTDGTYWHRIRYGYWYQSDSGGFPTESFTPPRSYKMMDELELMYQKSKREDKLKNILNESTRLQNNHILYDR